MEARRAAVTYTGPQPDVKRTASFLAGNAAQTSLNRRCRPRDGVGEAKDLIQSLQARPPSWSFLDLIEAESNEVRAVGSAGVAQDLSRHIAPVPREPSSRDPENGDKAPAALPTHGMRDGGGGK